MHERLSSHLREEFGRASSKISVYKLRIFSSVCVVHDCIASRKNAFILIPLMQLAGLINPYRV